MVFYYFSTIVFTFHFIVHVLVLVVFYLTVLMFLLYHVPHLTPLAARLCGFFWPGVVSHRS